MGFFDFIGDLLLGTEGEAQRRNEGLLQRGEGYLQGVDLAGLFGQARGTVTGQGRTDILDAYRQAVAQAGAAGTGASLDTLARERSTLGDVRKNLGQRGLYGSSLMGQATAGTRDMTSRTLAGISGQTAGAQSGLLASRGHALASEEARRQALMASLFSGQAGMELGRAQSLGQLLSGFQYEGQPGLLGPMLGQLAGAFTGGMAGPLGGLGARVGTSLFG